MNKKERIGIIGLGIIGSRIAENLRKQGHEVYVWSRSPKPVPNFLGSAEDVARACNVLQFFVSDDAALLQCVQSVAAVLTKKHVLLFHPTVSPETIKRAGGIVECVGASWLEAPFTGSKDAAAKGLLVYYAGGPEELVKRMEPLLLDSGKAVIHIGDAGQASALKIAMNMMIGGAMQVLAEGLAVAKSAGITPEKFREGLALNAVNSPLFEMKLPLILEKDFSPHFSVRHLMKDLRHGKKLVDSAHLATPAIDSAFSSLQKAEADGKIEEDFSVFTQYATNNTAETNTKSLAE